MTLITKIPLKIFGRPLCFCPEQKLMIVLLFK